MELIQKWNTRDENFGYNISIGGDVTTISPDGRKRLSEQKKGKNNPCFGKIYTTEERARISEQTRGENNPNFGRIHTEEERQKMSEANRGKKLSEEQKTKISQGLRKRYAGKILPEGFNKRNTKVVCVETGEVFESIAEAARSKNMYDKRTCIGKVCKGIGNMCGGYHWKYYESSVS